MNWSMPIIASDPAKQMAPSAVHGVGNRASNAAHTIAHSTAMYTVTGAVSLSVPRYGQNQASSATHRAHITATATRRRRDRTAHGGNEHREHRWATQEAARAPHKDR